MNIKFNSVELCNFMSYSSATLHFNHTGYVLVKGNNNNVVDMSRSNGSGKSALFDSIVWCLTGETIRNSKDVTNMFASDGVYVVLDFNVDNHHYSILRSKDHSVYKTTIRFIVDNKDISGKGVRDTEKIIQSYLPQLTSQLIGSVIILGQGLPQRFSNNTPSGRKQVLEQLTNSDFMIEDVKQRLAKRTQTLLSELRETELELTRQETQKTQLEEQLKHLQSSYESLKATNNLQIRINSIEEELTALNVEDAANSDALYQNTQLYNELLTKQLQLTNEFHINHDSVKQKYVNDITAVQIKTAELKTKSNLLNQQIRQLESIVDICPTCKQHIPDVHKVDTTELRSEYQELINNVNQLNQQFQTFKTLENDEIEELNRNYNQENNAVTSQLKTVSGLKEFCELQKQQIAIKQANLQAERDALTYSRDNQENQLIELELDIDACKEDISRLNSSILYIITSKDRLIQHQEVNTKMTTLVTRDFRGYLLRNIISYITEKAKRYCEYVFETTKFEFFLDGNKLCISYDGKEYECLSGGEKQKIDIILQFSIRDMLCNLLNFSSNILVLDEIMDNLDDVGCDRVISLITNNLKDVESTYIISHHVDIPIPYDNEIIITKGVNKLSTIE